MSEQQAAAFSIELEKQQTAEQILNQGLDLSGDAAFALFSQAIQQARLEGNHSVEGQALLAKGKLYRDSGDLNAAITSFHIAFKLAKNHKDTVLEGDALNQRAGINHLLGNYALASQDLQSVLEIAKQANDSERVSNYLINLGILSTKLGDYPQALKSLRKAYKIARKKLDSPLMEGQCLINLGLLYEEMGDNESALEVCQQAVEKLKLVDQKQLEAIATVNLGYAHQRLGNLSIALSQFLDAKSLAQEIDFPKVEIAALDGQAQVLEVQGQFIEAISIHQEAFEKSQDSNDFEGELDALNHLARAYLKIKQPDKAQDCLYKCLNLAETAGRKKTIIEAHELLAETYEQQNKLDKAIEHLKAFQKLDKALFNEENNQKTRQLAIHFDLERAKHEADFYRLHSEFERDAKEKAEAVVKVRTEDLERSYATIEEQHAELALQVTHLNNLLLQNEGLRQRLMQASQRNVALNERTLRRLSAELHDGPAQDLGFALLKLESGELFKTAQTLPHTARNRYETELERIQSSLQRALVEIRAVATDMCLPELEHLSLTDVVKRVVRKHQRRTQTQVTLSLELKDETVLLPVKITIHRVIQEALTNAFKHGGGKEQRVELVHEQAQLKLKIEDKGKGFAVSQLKEEHQDHLGLLGMRERVASLGGIFSLQSEIGKGAIIEVDLPLSLSAKSAPY